MPPMRGALRSIRATRIACVIASFRSTRQNGREHYGQ